MTAVTEFYRPFTLSGFNRPLGTLNGSCENQTVRLIRGLAFLPLCALLAGCGTNVQYLLSEEGRLTPEGWKERCRVAGIAGLNLGPTA